MTVTRGRGQPGQYENYLNHPCRELEAEEREGDDHEEHAKELQEVVEVLHMFLEDTTHLGDSRLNPGFSLDTLLLVPDIYRLCLILSRRTSDPFLVRS